MPTHDRDSDVYLEQVRPLEYEALMAATLENAEVGVGAISTAPFVKEFADPSWIERTRTHLAAYDVAMTLIWVSCDATTMHTYLRRRGAARDTTKLSDWSAYLSAVDLDFRPAAEHAEIQKSASSDPLKGQASHLLTQLASQE